MKTSKKLLIIVGGGVYGCIPARLLAGLPQEYHSLTGVDCLSGCSIGGILAAAQGSGASFESIDSFFQERVDDCFSRRLCSRINPLACPTYDSSSLRKALRPILGKKTLADTREVYPDLDIFIPTLNITKDKYKVFDNIDDGDTSLMDVAMMTSAAPSYYSGVTYKRDCYIDGGLIEVAPLITAATALKGKRNVNFEDMDVLMIGTGKDIDDKPLYPKEYNDLSILGLATKVIVPYATLSNELATVYWGRNMGFRSFEYFNPCSHNGHLDDTSQVPDMVKQADEYRDEFIEVYSNWLNK